jgi:hypothetical protein
METIMNQFTDKADAIHGDGKADGIKTKRFEKMTSALPSSTWLVLAGGAMVASIACKIAGKNGAASFVGQWVPTFLILGIYNKLAKVAGGDRADANGESAHA